MHAWYWFCQTLSRLESFSIRLSCVAPYAQRPQVAELVGSSLGLGYHVIDLSLTLVATDTAAVLALPRVTYQGGLPQTLPRA